MSEALTREDIREIVKARNSANNMTYGTILEVLDRVLEEAKRDKVAFHGEVSIEYLCNIQDYTGEGQREVYRIERRVE